MPLLHDCSSHGKCEGAGSATLLKEVLLIKAELHLFLHASPFWPLGLQWKIRYRLFQHFFCTYNDLLGHCSFEEPSCFPVLPFYSHKPLTSSDALQAQQQKLNIANHVKVGKNLKLKVQISCNLDLLAFSSAKTQIDIVQPLKSREILFYGVVFDQFSSWVPSCTSLSDNELAN